MGWAAAVLAYSLVFSLVSPNLAWRLLFLTGAVPALLILYLRRTVRDVGSAEAARHSGSGAVAAILRGTLGRRTLFACVLSTGVQGGYYTLATWLPSYLKTARGLTVVGTGSYLALLIGGAFTGYVLGGYVSDRIGRKYTFALFAALSALLLFAYTRVPEGANGLLLALGFPLGLCASAIFSGFGSFLAELYPAHCRGTGQGVTYNFGRAVGAVFPALVGYLSSSVGVGAAMAFGALAYALAAISLLGLPETRATTLPEEQ